MNDPPVGTTSVKILVAGGFGVGKTTLVGSVSEIEPLTTEAEMTSIGLGIDDASHLPRKTSTTVALDFGRISLREDLILYLFGTPGQERFWFLWDELARGAIGAVVLADVRRLADAFAAIDFFEARGMPHVVAVNQFEGARAYSEDSLREALAIPDATPVLVCDARLRDSTLGILIKLVEHALAARRSEEDDAG